MAKVMFNRQLSKDFWHLRAEHGGGAGMGQFFMVRAWDTYPVLSRPLSVFDCDAESVTFLYKVVGQGTELLAKLKEGDELTLAGPYGNGWPELTGNIALVGGGVGIAPLYLAAKQLHKLDADSELDLYLGFSDVALLQEEYRAIVSRLTVAVGGFITDKIDPMRYDHILACGPDAMMRRLYEKCKIARAEERLYVSLEERMGCGMGVCLTCTRQTSLGNKKVCADGPVFRAMEVYEDVETEC